MYARKVALLPCIMQNEYSFLKFGYIVQYKRHFWQKWNTVLNKDGNLLIVSERAANNKFTLAMLAVGLASVVSAVNAIINAYFGIQYFFALLSAEYIICILLLIKSDDKTEDKL